MDEYGAGVVKENLNGPSPEQQWGKKARVAHTQCYDSTLIPKLKPATCK